ncbi:MAG: alkaline phosphatase PhoX [Magnetospiraceae bacterium]
MTFKTKLLAGAALTGAVLSTGIAAPAQADPLDSKYTLTRVATVPAGSEVTGLAVNAMGELFFNAQHPGGDDEYTPGAVPAFIGYVSGLDISSGVDHLPMPAPADWMQANVGEGTYIILGEAGEAINGGTQVLGGVYDVDGNLMYVSNDADVNSFVPLSDTAAYLYTGWEGAGIKGASAISRLKLNKVGGVWVADLDASEMINLSSIYGGWVLCFGHETPWNSALVAEEYYYLNTALWNYPGHHDDNYLPYYLPTSTNLSYHIPGIMGVYRGEFPNPYHYGYQIEITDRDQATPTLVKHYAMGRFSHENGVVMPDNKTVYQSDDDSGQYTSPEYKTNSGGVLFKFVADVANDLSAGTLYAAKIKQIGGTDIESTKFKVEWIELAHGSNAQIADWIAEYDQVTDADYVAGESSYVSDEDVLNWAEGKRNMDIDGNGVVGTYPDDRPAFLESRKAAAAMGATYDWNKMEGVTADGQNVYLAISSITQTMTTDWGDIDWMTGENVDASNGDIAMQAEACGGVYSAKLDKNFDISLLKPATMGESKTYANPDNAGVECNLDKIANPDNILSIGKGQVLIGEDSGDHGVDMLWLATKND